MLSKIKGKIVHFGLLAGIGGSLVTLVGQVQTALDLIADEREPAADPMPESETYATGYVAGWNDGHENRAPQYDVEGAHDE